MDSKTGHRKTLNLEHKTGYSLPAMALLIIISILPLFNGGLDHNVSNLALFFALAAALWLIIKYNVTLNRTSAPPFIFFGLLLLWSGISIFWSLSPHRTMIELLQLGLYGTAMFIATQITQSGYMRIGRIVIVVGTLLVLHGIMQNLLLGETTVYSTFHHHNPLGIYMVMLFFCSWGYYQKQGKTVALIVSIIFLIGLFISGSRGALLALLVSLPLIFISLERNRRVIVTFALKTFACMLIAFIIATAIIGIPAVFTEENPNEQAQSTEEAVNVSMVNTGPVVDMQFEDILGRPDYMEAHNILARFSYWKVGFEQLQAKPLQGYGLGTYYASYLLADYWPRMHFARFAHNHYLQTAVETGAIGFLFLAGFLVTSLLVIKNKTGIDKISFAYPGVLSALLAYLVHIGIDFTWNVPAVSVLFFCLLGIVLGHREMSGKADNRSGTYPEIDINTTRTAGRNVLLAAALLLLLFNSWYYTASLFYSQALKAEQAGDHTRAVAIYDTVNRFYPINGRAYYFSASNHITLYEETADTKHLNNALVNSQRAADLNPVDPLARNTLGVIYANTGNVQAARKQLFLGHKYSPNYLPRFVNAANKFMDDGEASVAERYALRGLEHADYAIQVSSGTGAEDDMIRAAADLHLILVEAYEAQGYPDKADKHLRLAEEIMPDHPSLQSN